ncbi:hypothetical protein [Streptomyces clavifer]|uniref:hypothetical protein n=1 Tax=Streptomyces clavifer TaxID=68188 RepID=UPI003652EC4C
MIRPFIAPEASTTALRGTHTSSTDIDLDTLPPHTLVVENGQVTPIGKVVIAKVANDLTAVCLGADDPQAAIQLVLQLIPKCMAEIVSERSNVEPSPLRGALPASSGPSVWSDARAVTLSPVIERTASRTPTTPGTTVCRAPVSTATVTATVTLLGRTGNERRYRHDDFDA